MNTYYVIGTELVKKKEKFKEVTDEHAVPAKDLDHLKLVCDQSYIRWEFVRGPYKMNQYWDNFKYNFERDNI